MPDQLYVVNSALVPLSNALVAEDFGSLLLDDYGISVGLYSGPTQVGENTVYTDLSFPDFVGSANQLLQANGSPAPIANLQGGTLILTWAAPFVFTCFENLSAAQIVYGYIVVDNYSNLYWIVQFATPFVFQNYGDTLTFFAQFSFFSQNE